MAPDESADIALRFEDLQLRDWVVLEAGEENKLVLTEGRIYAIAHILDSEDQEHMMVSLKTNDGATLGNFGTPLWRVRETMRLNREQ